MDTVVKATNPTFKFIKTKVVKSIYLLGVGFYMV